IYFPSSFMSSKGRILIPGLYDTDESDNEETASTQPDDNGEAEELIPEVSGEDMVVEQEEMVEDARMEPQEEVEEEEEEEEYDPSDAPFLIRRPQLPAAPPVFEQREEEGGEHEDDEEPPELVRCIAEDDLDEVDVEPESPESSEFFFVVDVHNRCIRILKEGYGEKEYTTLERIPGETLAMLNERVYTPNTDDDDHFYCEQCVMSFRICCMKHPLYRIMDRPVTHPVEDRAKKTLPAFIRIRPSSIPNAGLGAFTSVELPVGMVFGPYQGVLSKESDTRGYSWEIRNVDAPSVFLDGSDPKYSNWMRYINSPRHDREQNLVAFQYNGSVYYRIIKPIDNDQELLVWYGAKYGESLGVFSTKKSVTKSRSNTSADVRNPFIM
ncbi:hypothetical protein PFISCL1PPCAC_11385, partial [Pristionchus fissidentatus]